MKTFMNEDFLLKTETAKKLYGSVKDLPIIDYHCHLSPKEIWEDQCFSDLSEAWLGGDHYKWRAMRAAGVPEELITGDRPGIEKFRAYAETLEKCIGNPLYHWSHMELRHFFHVEEVLNRESADRIFARCSADLKTKDFSPRALIRRSKVEVVCTTDDPVDSLEYHEKLAKEDLGFSVYPAWRPDKAVNVDLPTFLPYLKALEEASEMKIASFKDLVSALEKRLLFFASRGASVSDHGIDYMPFRPAGEAEVEGIFRKRLSGGEITKEECETYKTALLLKLGRTYHRLGFVMQIHFGARRNNNQRMYAALGPDTGYDCINNHFPAGSLIDYLNALNETGELPKTILYSLNPIDNAILDAIAGCFQGEVPGKIQHGAAWWFNDTKDGMEAQLRSYASIGVLGTFIGMLTDSRSFLSYPRHDYFRRILADLIGEWVENGEYPDDEKALFSVMRGISYENARAYFDFRGIKC